MKNYTVLVVDKPSKFRTQLVQKLEGEGCTVFVCDPRYDSPDPSIIKGLHRHLYEGVSTLLTPGRFSPPGAEVPKWLSSYLQDKTAIGKVTINATHMRSGGDAGLISVLVKQGFGRDSWAIPLALTAKSVFNSLRSSKYDNRPETKARIKKYNTKLQVGARRRPCAVAPRPLVAAALLQDVLGLHHPV